MSILELIIAGTFILGYIFIALERFIKIDKSIISLILSGILWGLIGINGFKFIEKYLHNMIPEIFGVVVFLLCAMTIVQVITHYKFFDLIKVKIYNLNLSYKKKFWILGVIAFFLSGIVDNLTATLVMAELARRFFSGLNLLIVGVFIVNSANGGGAFSPIGDLTTIMLWIAKKFTEEQVISYVLLPSFVNFLVAGWLLFRKLEEKEYLQKIEIVSLERSEKIVIIIGLLSFAFPFIFNKILHINPEIGIILGLGLTLLATSIFKRISNNETHLTAEIEHFLASVEHPAILFFIGILLAVGALDFIGFLDDVSSIIFGKNEIFERFVAGNTILGIISAFVDNIPLTAASMKIIETQDFRIWTLLAYCVGTGGSLIIFGSAAGVIAMSIIKELDFITYIKIGFLPIILGYIAGILVWIAQYFLFSFVGLQI